MLVVAGLSLKNLEPKVWDRESPFYIRNVSAVMVSYAEFHKRKARRNAAMEQGLRTYLGVPKSTQVFLDNGAFYFGSKASGAPFDEYEEFVERASPDWKPIPQDYIPFPSMSRQKQRGCLDRTMRVNLGYQNNGYVPVVHIGKYLPQYTSFVMSHSMLSQKPKIALGGIVPNLLRKTNALPYSKVLAGLLHVRKIFDNKNIHVFGVGGTATLHLVSLLGFDSADSSGWRNRAARGVVQLPGSGERLVADLGSWRGRTPSDSDWDILGRCECPACKIYGLDGLKANRLHGFRCRATHNLWILHEENAWLMESIANDSYRRNYGNRIDNSIYKPLIEELLKLLDK